YSGRRVVTEASLEASGTDGEDRCTLKNERSAAEDSGCDRGRSQGRNDPSGESREQYERRRGDDGESSVRPGAAENGEVW
ncbi:hypothetical protein PF011_g32340, partial [Phytophthora fragariae]